MKKPLPIYDGAITANMIGAFVHMGESFQVIRPGWDTQGKKRGSWTQVVHDGIPVFEVKLAGELAVAMREFDTKWTETIGENRALMNAALTAVKVERRRKFRDGVSGIERAPTMTQDGKPERMYVA